MLVCCLLFCTCLLTTFQLCCVFIIIIIYLFISIIISFLFCLLFIGLEDEGYTHNEIKFHVFLYYFIAPINSFSLLLLKENPRKRKNLKGCNFFFLFVGSLCVCVFMWVVEKFHRVLMLLVDVSYVIFHKFADYKLIYNLIYYQSSLNLK